MKKLQLLLLPILLLLSGGFTATQQTVLFSGGCPTIGGACPSINLNFTTGKYWVQGIGFVPLTSVVSTTRASSKICANAAGVLTSVGNNILCVTDKGALIEEARTNKSTNYNANPPALVAMGTAAAFNGAVTNMLASGGDGSTLFGVIDDSATTSFSVYANVANGRVYKLDNSAGAVVAFFTPVGGAGNTNTHTNSIVARSTGPASVLRYEDTLNGWVILPGATYSRVSFTGAPTTGTTRPQIRVPAGSIVWIFLNVFEEGAFVTSPIVIAGASATRAADVPQLIGPAATAALNAKAAFFQTRGVATATNPRLLDYNGTQSFLFPSASVAQLAISAQTASGTFGSGSYAGISKAAFGFDASGLTAKANGGVAGINATSFGTPTGPVYLGNIAGATRALNGYMQRFALSPVKGVFDLSTSP